MSRCKLIIGTIFEYTHCAGGIMELGERIRKVRKDCSITQGKFAERMLVSASYISKIESGKELPSDIFLKLMSLEFDVSLDWLRTGEGTKKININQHDYFERNQTYNIYVKKDILDFEETLDQMPNGIHASVSFMLGECTHILKSEYLTDSQKILITSIFADIFATITEMIDKFFSINKNDAKELLRFESFFLETSREISEKINEIKETLSSQKPN